MPFLPADAHGFDAPRAQHCLLEFSVEAHYNSHSLRIYMFSSNVDLKTEIIKKNILNFMRV